VYDYMLDDAGICTVDVVDDDVEDDIRLRKVPSRLPLRPNLHLFD